MISLILIGDLHRCLSVCVEHLETLFQNIKAIWNEKKMVSANGWRFGAEFFRVLATSSIALFQIHRGLSPVLVSLKQLIIPSTSLTMRRTSLYWSCFHLLRCRTRCNLLVNFWNKKISPDTKSNFSANLYLSSCCCCCHVTSESRRSRPRSVTKTYHYLCLVIQFPLAAFHWINPNKGPWLPAVIRRSTLLLPR